MGFIEDAALRMEGVSEDSLARLKNCEDDLLHLVATFKIIWPRVNRVAPTLMQVAQEIIEKQKELK